MRRFFGMMPTDEIEKEVTYKAKGIMFDVRIIIQAGPNGWTVIWPDHGTNYKDETSDTETNFNTAYELAKKTYPDMVEVEDNEAEEECDCCEECCEECCDEDDGIDNNLLNKFNELIDSFMPRIVNDWKYVEELVKAYSSRSDFMMDHDRYDSDNIMNFIDRHFYLSDQYDELSYMVSNIDKEKIFDKIHQKLLNKWDGIEDNYDANELIRDLSDTLEYYDSINKIRSGDAIKYTFIGGTGLLSIIHLVLSRVIDAFDSDREYSSEFASDITIRVNLGAHSYKGHSYSLRNRDEDEHSYNATRKELRTKVEDCVMNKILPILKDELGETQIHRLSVTGFNELIISNNR